MVKMIFRITIEFSGPICNDRLALDFDNEAEARAAFAEEVNRNCDLRHVSAQIKLWQVVETELEDNNPVRTAELNPE